MKLYMEKTDKNVQNSDIMHLRFMVVSHNNIELVNTRMISRFYLENLSHNLFKDFNNLKKNATVIKTTKNGNNSQIK